MSNSVGSVNAIDSVFGSVLVKDIPFNFINGTLTLFVGDKQYSVGKEDVRMGEIKSILNDSLKTVEDLQLVLDRNSVEKHVNDCPVNTGKAYVKDGEVYFNDELVSGVLAERIKECMAFGLSFEHMLKFMENVWANPSYRSRTELFDFLGNKSLPITPDGCFLGYKAIRNDWMDKYKGVIDNSITGKPVTIPRTHVDDDRERECSFGLHVGALPYVESYSNGTTDRIVYVKVNPKDVVAVPKDHNAQKVRVCEYLVIGEYKGELNQSPVYGNDITPQGSPINTDDWDDNWDDEDYDEEDEFEPSVWDDDDYDEEDDWEDDDDGWNDEEDNEDTWDDGECGNDDDDDLDDDVDEYGCGVYQSPNPLPNPLYNPLANVLEQEKNKAIEKYGVKPSGQRYWNVRNGGKFVKE